MTVFRLTILALVAACGGSPDGQAGGEGTPLRVPSDPNAEYYIIDRGGTADRPTITTKRSGPSGVSYSIREYDCSNRTVRYLADAETREQLPARKIDEPMGPIVAQSIADYVGRAACGR